MCLGTVGVIVDVSDDDGLPMALIGTGQGEPARACLLACPEAGVGQTVLVHCGYVLRVVDDEQEPS